jgi:hypothetical protein
VIQLRLLWRETNDLHSDVTDDFSSSRRSSVYSGRRSSGPSFARRASSNNWSPRVSSSHRKPPRAYQANSRRIYSEPHNPNNHKSQHHLRDIRSFSTPDSTQYGQSAWSYKPYSNNQISEYNEPPPQGEYNRTRRHSEGTHYGGDTLSDEPYLSSQISEYNEPPLRRDYNRTHWHSEATHDDGDTLSDEPYLNNQSSEYNEPPPQGEYNRTRQHSEATRDDGDAWFGKPYPNNQSSENNEPLLHEEHNRTRQHNRTNHGSNTWFDTSGIPMGSAELAEETMSSVVCTEDFLPSAFPHITSMCEHEPGVCRACIAECIQGELDTRGWDQISCPECRELLNHAEVTKYADADTLERYNDPGSYPYVIALFC